MYRAIFRDLNSFKRELKSLSKHKPFKTLEVKSHFIPNTVSFESYMYGLDKRAVIDVAVSDIVEEAMMKNEIKEKEREEIALREQEEERKIDKYLSKVRDMVR